METDFSKAPVAFESKDKSQAEAIGDTVLAMWHTMRNSKNPIPYGDVQITTVDGNKEEAIVIRVYNKAKN